MVVVAAMAEVVDWWCVVVAVAVGRWWRWQRQGKLRARFVAPLLALYNVNRMRQLLR